MQSAQCYTLSELLAAISKDTTFESDFRYLPRATTIQANFIETVHDDGEAENIQRRILVGHTDLLSEPIHSRRRRVWAYIVSDLNDKSCPRDFGYCLRDMTDLTDLLDLTDNCLEVKLLEPFARIAEIQNQKGRDWRVAIAIVLEFYYLEKGFIQQINMTSERFHDFKRACSIYAAFEISQKRPPSRAPLVMASLPAALTKAHATVPSRSQDQDSAPRTSSHLHGALKRPRSASQARSQYSHIHVDSSVFEGPRKRLRQEAYFVEYQNLIQRIRRDADADIDTSSKAEVERLKLCIGKIQQENKDTGQLLEAECTKTVNLSSQVSLLQARNKELEQAMDGMNKVQGQKTIELEKEMQELREFRQKVKGLF